MNHELKMEYTADKILLDCSSFVCYASCKIYAIIMILLKSEIQKGL